MKIVDSAQAVISKLQPTEGFFSSTFHRIDTEKLKTKLKIKEEALARGQQNLPKAEATYFDDVEGKIVLSINNELDEAKKIYRDNHRSYEDRINSMSSLGHEGRFDGIVNESDADIRMQFQRRKDDLHNSKSEIATYGSYLEKFKKENGLDKPAVYPKSRIWCWAIIVFLIVVETAASGIFFAEGDEFGVVGGFLKAFIPSVLNVTFGFFLASFGFRFLTNINPSKRTIGSLVCVVVPLLVLALNLLTTHYRTAVALMMEDASTSAFTSFVATPFAIHDVNSAFLLILGIVCTLLAAWDFWKMDDPYLGHGKVDRDHKEKINEYIGLKAEALEELDDIRDRSLNALKSWLHQLTNRFKEMQTILDSKRRMKSLYLDHLEHLENAGNVLLQSYKNLNLSVRSEKYPVYENEKLVIEKVVPEESEIDFEKLLQLFKEESASAQAIYSKGVAKINKVYSEIFEEYQTIDQLRGS